MKTRTLYKSKVYCLYSILIEQPLSTFSVKTRIVCKSEAYCLCSYSIHIEQPLSTIAHGFEAVHQKVRLLDVDMVSQDIPGFCSTFSYPSIVSLYGRDDCGWLDSI